MLVARNQVSANEVLFRFHAAVERAFRLYGIERRNNILDTRFLRGASRMGGGELVLMVLVDGWIHWHDGGLGSLQAPAAFVATLDALDGQNLTTGARSSGGEPYRALELIFVRDPERATRAPFERIEPTDALLAAARAYFDETSEARVRDFLAAASSVVPAAAELAPTIVSPELPIMQRMWDTFASSDLLATPFPSLQELVDRAGVSTSHFSRQVKEIMEAFHVDWEGWRDLTNDARLRWAIVMVSSPTLSIGDVARASGYASTDVLDATFRRAGLPAPSEVRRQILAAVAELPHATLAHATPSR